MYDFNDRIIWITGASSGIGESLVYLLSKSGAKIVLSARNEDKLNTVAGNCKGSDNMVLKMDLENNKNLASDAALVIKKYGKIDMLINCGGVSQKAVSYETPEDVERKIIEINYWGTVNLTKAVLPYMLKNNSGRIVVISSVHGKLGMPAKSSYTASKHALQGYFDSLWADLLKNGHGGVKITVVCPGYVKTNISINYLDKAGKNIGVMDDEHANAMDPETCAQKIISAINKDKKEVLIGGKEVLAVYLKRFFPSFFLDISYRF